MGQPVEKVPGYLFEHHSKPRYAGIQVEILLKPAHSTRYGSPVLPSLGFFNRLDRF